MSTRGLLAFRFEGLDYVTYNHSDSYPKALGCGIVRFAREHLAGREAIRSFGRKIAAVEWLSQPRNSNSIHPQGAELLEAIACGRAHRIVHDCRIFQTALDCEFAYILDLDAEVLEFWDLPERVESFALASLSPFAVGIMECGRRR
jgi:hypothetical protein